MKRFTAYLVREILPLYAAGVAAFIILLLGLFLIEVLAGVLARGTSPALVAQFLLYSLPAAAGRALPLALLFASLLGLTRLSQDSEIKAALVLGLSPREFMWPLLTLGLIVAGLSFLNNEVIVPPAQARALQVQRSILLESPEVFLEEGSFFTDSLGRSIYIEDLNADGFRNVTVIESTGSAPRMVMSAASGRPLDDDGVWELSDIRFDTYRNSRLVLKTTAESARLPVRELAAGSANPPDLTSLPFRDLWLRIGSQGGRNSAEWTAFHRKFAEPAAAIAFALFALAVALVSFRTAAGLGLVGVLFLTFIYYATWAVSNSLGAQGVLPAWVAGWLPVFLYAAAGGGLLTFAWRR